MQLFSVCKWHCKNIVLRLQKSFLATCKWLPARFWKTFRNIEIASAVFQLEKIRGQGQGQTFSKPRTKDTDASVLQKKCLQKFFSGDLKKKRSSKKLSRRSPKEEDKKSLRKFSARFLALSNKILSVQKIVLSSSRGRSNFLGVEASRPRPRT